MSADLTLPGTIPGLLRKCSPVNVDGRGSGVVVDKPGDKVDWFRVLCDGCEDEPDAESRSCVHLDLTDATGRTHAAWWLAGQPGASWTLSSDGYRRWEIHGGERPRESVSRAWEGIGAAMRAMRGPAPAYGWDAEDVPTLDDLDPDDDRRLPDGSRVVDAEALRRVVLHVAGVPA